jgi:hypothetical protein
MYNTYKYIYIYVNIVYITTPFCLTQSVDLGSTLHGFLQLFGQLLFFASDL